MKCDIEPRDMRVAG